MEVTELATNIQTDALSGVYLHFNSEYQQTLILHVRDGICVKESEMVTCYDHDDCDDSQFCIVGYCGQEAYFDAIKDIQCQQDSVCEVGTWSK